MNKEHEKLLSPSRILGLNLLILVAYSLLWRLLDNNYVIDALFIVGHIIIALGIASAEKERRKVWLLSALLVLLLGYTTCGYIVAQ